MDIKYLPTLEAEKRLINHQIPGVLLGLSVREKTIKHGIKESKENIKYYNTCIYEGIFDNDKVWNVYSDVSVYTEESTYTLNKVWLASIPRLDEDGLFTVNGNRYYIVLRLVLASNTPICRLMERTNNSYYKCTIRSVNYHTLESRSISIYRSPKKPHNVLLNTGIKNSKPCDLISYLYGMTITGEGIPSPAIVLQRTAESLGCKGMALQILKRNMLDSSNITPEYYIVPSGVYIDSYDTTPEHRFQSLPNDSNINVSSEYITLCEMLVKLLNVECGIESEDDLNDYSNNHIEDYSTLMSLLFRKEIMRITSKRLTGIIGETAMIYKPFISAIINNEWGVVGEYNTDLKLSRCMEVSNDIGTENSLQEVIRIMASYGGSDDSSQTHNVRMLHPSQRGFMCMVRTTDDINAGLRGYLSSDCRISSHWEHRNSGFNNAKKELDFLSDRYINYVDSIESTPRQLPEKHILWLHNSMLCMSVDSSLISHVLEDLKKSDPYFSWNYKGSIVESRTYYGRMCCKVMALDTNGDEYETLFDTIEMSIRKSEVITLPSPFSKLCYEVPFMNRMPVSRTMLSTKIIQKCISAPTINDSNLAGAQLCYPQSPIVSTTKSSGISFGTNCIVCYTTLEGYGVEDGIILNAASVERGLFSILQRIRVEWRNEDDRQTVKDYTIEVSKYEVVKRDRILATVTYTTRDMTTKVAKIKHTGSYRCTVQDIIVSYKQNHNKSASGLVSILIVMSRYKRVNTGDKFSSRFGQKSVCVSIRRSEDMPFIGHSNIGLPPIPDVIVNPLSIASRSTVSQDICSTLGLNCIQNNYISCKEIPFGDIHMIDSRGNVVDIDLDKIDTYKIQLFDGITGELRQGLATVGIEYYMTLNHLADMKIKSKGSAARDDITGAIITSNQDTCVRYNWQELIALMHGKNLDMASYIYNTTGELGSYPYCLNCNCMVDADRGICNRCDSAIENKISVAKPLVVVKNMLRIIGSDLNIEGK